MMTLKGTNKKDTPDACMLASIIESSEDAIVNTDLGGIILNWNKGAEEIYGYAPEEVRGRHISILVPPERAEEVKKILDKVRNGESVSHYETVRVKRGGERLYVSLTGSPVRDDAGNIIGASVTTHNITEKKVAEEALKESRETFLALLNAVTESAFLTDTAGNVIAANRTTAERLGTTVDILSGRNFYDFMPPDVAESRKKYAEQALSTRKPVRFVDFRMGRYIDNSIYPVLDEKGEVKRLAVFGYDVTMHKLTEDALKRSSAEIEDLYNSAPCGYHSLDKDGVFVRMNDTELRWLGYRREEVIGKLRFPDIITPGCLKTFEKHLPDVKSRGWVRDLEYELVRKDGATFTVILSATAVKDSQGNFVMTRSTMHDITELKYAEDELKRTNAELQKALSKVKLLSGLLPICASCKKIKTEKGWERIERYIERHSEAEFSHGICDECAKKLYPDIP